MLCLQMRCTDFWKDKNTQTALKSERGKKKKKKDMDHEEGQLSSYRLRPVLMSTKR